MGTSQKIGTHTSDGTAAQTWPATDADGDLPAAPDLGIGYAHTAPLAGVERLGIEPDGADPQINITQQAGTMNGEDFAMLARRNHSAVTREFYAETKTVAAGATEDFNHGFGHNPDMYHAQLAANPGAACPWWVCADGIDGDKIRVENAGANPIEVRVTAWTIHSIDYPHQTNGPIDDTIDGGGVGATDFPHGLDFEPDLILAFPCQNEAAGAYNGNAIALISVDDANVALEATAAAGGTSIPVRLFVQRTHSIQA